MNKRKQNKRIKIQQKKDNKKRLSRNKHNKGIKEFDKNSVINYKKKLIMEHQEFLKNLREQQKSSEIKTEKISLEQRQETMQF